ncbi:MAG: hypothetical protein JRJ65_17025, partial [Deltaproteobacteria bacterium]|nr:hypothetical protein [Deltaproteobacteria bacterium]
MYPAWSEEEVWDICLSLLEKDIPFPTFRDSIKEFRDDFHQIYEQIRDEHSHIKGKYFRDKRKKPIVNPINLAHYTRLIYYFSRLLIKKNVDRFILDQLFLSIKTRCCIDLFYEFDIKKYFLPAHALATVMGRAQYSDYLVVHQNCTIGNNKRKYPKLGKGVILGAGSIVLGDCRIGDNVYVAAGALVIDSDIPSNSIAFGQVP